MGGAGNESTYAAAGHEVVAGSGGPREAVRHEVVRVHEPVALRARTHTHRWDASMAGGDYQDGKVKARMVGSERLRRA